MKEILLIQFEVIKKQVHFYISKQSQWAKLIPVKSQYELLSIRILKSMRSNSHI